MTFLCLYGQISIYPHTSCFFTALVMMKLLQLKLGNKILSAERSQRALSPYCCEEISKGIFHINLSALNNDYVIKIDEKENEYFSTELSDAFETVKLWFTIVFIYSFLFFCQTWVKEHRTPLIQRAYVV